MVKEGYKGEEEDKIYVVAALGGTIWDKYFDGVIVRTYVPEEDATYYINYGHIVPASSLVEGLTKVRLGDRLGYIAGPGSPQVGGGATLALQYS